MNPAGPHPHPRDPHDAADRLPADGNRAERRRAAAVAGHTGDVRVAQALLVDADPSVRATAFGALVRAGQLDETTLRSTARDNDAGVRRRVAEELGRHPAAAPPTDDALSVLMALLGDPDPLTAEAAAWALGEVVTSPGSRRPDHRPDRDPDPAADSAVAALVDAADHDDPLVREAVVAALGAIGNPEGLATVLTATTDRPAIRRRAVLALAAFLGEPGVDEALERATGDRDWQVRQAAELLRRPDP